MSTSETSLPILAAAMFAVSAHSARASAFDEAAVLNAIDKVVAEHRIYATCMSLDKLSHRVVQENWAREIKLGAEALRPLNPSVGFVARYAKAVEPSRLLENDMPLSTAMTYCWANEAQVQKFHVFDFSRLADAINKVVVRKR